MKRCNEGRVENRGSTLVTVVILLGTMTVMTLVFLRVGQRVTDEQLATVDTTRATYLAEAGISEALEALRSGKTGNVGTSGAPAYLGGGVVWVEATDMGGGLTQLDSFAMKDGGRSALRAVVEGGGGGGGGGGGVDNPNDPFFTMLFGYKKLNLTLNCLVDSWDSSLGTYASQATNTKDGFTYAGSEGGVSANDEINLSTGVHVFGDAHSGPGAPVLMGSGAYVSGSTTPSPVKVPLAPFTVPVIPMAGSYSVLAGKTKTLTAGSYHFKDITINKTAKLIIQGPATVVMDAFSTVTDATVELDCKNGPITIYDTGTWMTGKNFTLAPAPGSPVEAAVMVTKGTIKFGQGAKIYAGFYCPEATIQVDQGAEIWGALVADMITVAQNTRFHFDKNLKKYPLPWDLPDEAPDDVPASEPKILSWSKIGFPFELYKGDRRDPFSLLGVQKSSLLSPVEAWDAGNPYP